MPRINKTYTPTELKAAIQALQNTGQSEASARELLKRLYDRGWRVVNCGPVSEREMVRQPRGY